MGSTSNLFKITFLFSLLVHAVFFLPIPELKKPKQKQSNELNLAYLKIETPVKKKVAKFRHKKIKHKNLKKKALKKIPLKSKHDYSNKKIDLKKSQKSAEKNINNKSDKIARLEKRNQVLATPARFEKKDITKNKSYISYYKLINEQLRQSVIYPSRFSEGEIGLSFVLDCDGNLKNVKILKTTSMESDILKETAMQIVKKASPFPPFPKNLQQKQLTFNIVFCFKESS